jgi:hypothetical protein
MENIHISKIITISVGETPTDSINKTKKSEAFSYRLVSHQTGYFGW